MDNIFSCEKAYFVCFSESSEDNRIITYTDDFIKDMYDHNFFYVRSGAVQKDVINNINQKFKEIQETGHCSMIFASDYDECYINEILKNLKRNMEMSKCGCYILNKSKVAKWKDRKDCKIITFTEDKIDDVINKDKKKDGETLGEDFCVRRAVRKGNVYINNDSINNYLLYYNNELIGSCELFIYNKIAKIEDFAVLEQYQRKGYGTTLLKYVVNKALEKGSETIFLDTDEGDTAKEMYIKLGFSKIFENYKILWADWME